MKLKCKYSLTFIASLAILLPMSAFAEDQKQDEAKQETKKGGSQRHELQAAPQGPAHVSPSSVGKSRGEIPQNEGRTKTAPQSNVAPTSQSVQPGSRAERGQRNQAQSNVAPATSQSVQPSSSLVRSQRNQTQSSVATVAPQGLQRSSRLDRSQRNLTQIAANQQSYNKSNSYGGLWFAENTHSDWNREGNHYWNSHNYRWYEGGWSPSRGGIRRLRPSGSQTNS